MLDQSDSKHNSVALHLSPHVSPRTSPSGSRKSSYNSLNAFGSVIDNAYSLPPDQIDGGDYSKLDHHSRPPELPPKTDSSTEPSQYGKLDHSHNRSSILSPAVTTSQENQYGKLNHSKQPETILESQGQYGKLNNTSRTSELPQGAIVVQQENEYGKLNHSDQHAASPEPQSEYGKLVHNRPPELPPKRKTSQESEYGKLDHSKQFTRSPEPHDKPNYTNTTSESAVQEKTYGHLNRHDVVETPVDMQQSNYGQLDHTGFTNKGKEKQIQQNTPTIQQYNYQNQGSNFSPEAQYDKVPHKPPIARRKSKQPSNSGKVSNLQTSEVPAGYATFKREHGYSIGSSVSSYNSDVEDQLVDNDVTSNDDTGYSQLNPIILNNTDTPPSTYDSPVKPKPKPRYI